MSVPDAVESRIAGAPLSAHVATGVAGRPHVAPVWYGYRDGVLSFLTGGRKLANARRNERAAVSIERSVDGDVAWNVTLLGTVTVVDDAERIDAAESWIYDAYDGEDETVTDGSGDDALVEFDAGSTALTVYD